MKGYYKMPDKTAEDVTADGFLKTGDRGDIDEKGRLKLTGRVKELFKTAKGKYVAPAPIESKLSEQVALDAICVAGSGLPQPIALATVSPELGGQLGDKAFVAALTQELEQHLQAVNSTLEHHEQLDCLVLVAEPWTIENGFLTPTLKIRRNVIEAHYMNNADQWTAKKQRVVWA